MPHSLNVNYSFLSKFKKHVSSSVVLIACTVLALIFANIPVVKEWYFSLEEAEDIFNRKIDEIIDCIKSYALPYYKKMSIDSCFIEELETYDFWSIGYKMTPMYYHAIGEDEYALKHMEESIKRFETVFPAAGSSNSAIELTIPEMERYSGYTAWIDVCKAWQ